MTTSKKTATLSARQRNLLLNPVPQPTARAGNASGFEPVWEGAFKRHTEVFVNKHLWRIKRSHDFDDAMQEAFVIFWYCARKYRKVIDNPAWLMSIYKVALAQRFTDLAWYDSKRKAVFSTVADLVTDDQPELIEHAVGDIDNAGQLLTRFKQAPREIREALAIMMNAPLELLAHLGVEFPEMRRQGHMAQACRKMHRLLGPMQLDTLLDQVKPHFE